MHPRDTTSAGGQSETDPATAGPQAGRQPAIFIGHGSPMNIVADNSYTRDLEGLGTALAKPRAVLVVSAHWATRGFFVGSDEANLTIHDFYGFPDELYEKRYPAPGAPDVAQRVVELTGGVVQTAERGLDHAAWAPLIRIWPAADVPVLELSLDLTEPAADHYALARLLAPLRDEGVLLMGSGNVVHNLNRIDWDENAPPFQWATEFDVFVAGAVAGRRHQDLVDYLGHPLGRAAAPTPDHYLPLLYVLGAQGADESVATVHEGIQHGSVSMRCLHVG
jgi:4,5-DOPA dioxygenase extradiol